jgi:transposase-like protein
MSNPFRYFNSSPEVIRLVVMMYVRYPLSLRNVEDLLAERGVDFSHEGVVTSTVFTAHCLAASGERVFSC